MIHVCYCFRDETGNYAKFAGTSMLSLFENTSSEVTVHILHDNSLTPDNRDKFSYVAGQYGQLVKFYNLDELCPKKIAEIVKLVPGLEKSKVTVGAFYKLLIPQILPTDISKVIFIDPDTIVNLDINELWQMELSDKVLGVVPEAASGTNSGKTFLLCKEGKVKPEDYFNGGVLLMNLNILRDEEENIMQGIKFRGDNPEHKLLEQTVLNYCFSERTLKLPLMFNCVVQNVRKNKDQVLERKVYHYADGSRIGINMNDLANRLWMSFFIKTPWFDEASIGRLYTSLQKIFSDLSGNALKISTALQGKMRVFFIEPKKVESLTNFFSIKNYEEVILAENEESLKKLINTMKKFKDVCVFFITTEKFMNKNFPFDQLKKEGFAEGKDFLKAWNFLPNVNALSKTYGLIELM